VCGRFTLTKSERAELEDEMGISRGSLSPAYQPRFNIAPTDEHFIVRQHFEDIELVPAKWGLINHWVKPGERAVPQINARLEGIEKRPAFRGAFLQGRCLVPADGFFEWTGPKAKRQPLWFHRPDKGLLMFAGLYESYRPQPEVRQRTFTIITGPANQLMQPFHDRMPIVLSEAQQEAWLNPKETDVSKLKALLRPPSEGLMIFDPVSPAVNSVKNDYAALLEPQPAALQLL
jgi:putative SOS response-associated peptidase YedK